MKNTVLSLLKSNGSRANAFYAFLNKGINAIVPILLIPICNNFFGAQEFGKMIYYQSLVGFIILFADYGFTVTGIKDCSVASNNQEKLNGLVIDIFSLKILFLLLGFIGLHIYVFAANNNLTTNDYLLFLFVLIGLSVQNLIPIWFFQGVKKSNRIALINIISKILLTLSVGIYLFFLNKKAIYEIAFLEFLSYFFSLLLCFYFLFTEFNFKLKYPSFNNIKHQLIVGFNYFIIIVCYWAVNSGSIIYLELTKVDFFEIGFLGIFLRLSYYTFAIFQPIIHSLIPFFYDAFSKSYKDGIQYFNRVFLRIILISTTVILIYILALNFIVSKSFDDKIYTYFLGNKLVPYLLAVWTLLLIINNFTANALLLTSNKISIYRNAQILNCVFAMCTLLATKHFLGIIAVPLGLISGEIVFGLFIFKTTYIHLNYSLLWKN